MTQEWISSLATQGLATDGSSFGAVAEELVAARDAMVVAPLNDLGLIRASGPDAAGFLHNLLTNDINGMTPGDARFAGLCTAKGRLLALFLIWRDGDDFLLMLPRDILPAILKKANNPKWDDNFNKALQELAWKTVVNYPLSGVKASAK